MRIFVSHYDSPHAAALVAHLRERGADVEQSPSSPHAGRGHDPRWHTWYAVGLPSAVAWCDTFVIAVGRSWDSTWMAEEAHRAYLRASTDPAFRLYRWDPDGVYATTPPPGGLLRYLARATPLPADGRQAAVTLLRRDGADPPDVRELPRGAAAGERS